MIVIKDTNMGIFWIYMTRPIVSQKTSAAKAEGQLSKSFGIGQLCSASVIVCRLLDKLFPYLFNLFFQKMSYTWE